MKRLVTTMALSAMVLFSAPDSSAFSFPWFKKKAEKTEAAAPAPKKSAYKKFVSKKGTKKTEGFVNLYKVGKEVWMEIPDSLFGKEVLISSVLTQCDNPMVPTGVDVSASATYELNRTDSLVLLLSPKAEVLVRDEDPSIEAALGTSRAQYIKYAFPVKYRSDDSTSVVVKATKLFSHANKDAMNLTKLYFGDSKISGVKFSKDGCNLESLLAFNKSVGAVSDFSAEITMSGIFGDLSEKPQITAKVQTLLTLMDAPQATYKKVDSRIGVSTRNVTSYSSTGEVRKEKMALRWNLEGNRRIDIYVDTLFSPSWSKAVCDGILAWNAAFEDAGLGSPISVLPATKDINLDDPLVNSVRFTPSMSGSCGASLATTGATIVSCHLNVPAGIKSSARKDGATMIADVDKRYLEYDLCDEAVCDYLKSMTMTVFGQCLGLARNYAGSTAFSASQLRDPEFTQANGITGSVLDNAVFNVLARPGDKERGVVLTTDRIGEYDKYAIAWLYDSKDFRFRDDMLYIPSQKVQLDPRGYAGDLGNDGNAFADAMVSHSLNIASMITPYLDRDDVDPSYQVLFLDYLWLNMYRASFYISRMVGGVYVSEVREGSDAKRFEAVPVAVQRAAVRKSYELFESMDSMDEFKDIIHLAGANKNVSEFNNQNRFTMLNVNKRLPVVAMSCRIAGSGYTPDMYISDLFDLMTKDLRKGSLNPGDVLSLQQFIVMLQSMNPVYAQNRSDVVSGGRVAALVGEKNYRDAVVEVPSEYADDFATLSSKYLYKFKSVLQTGRTCAKNAQIRGDIDFLLYLVNASLEGRN